MDIGVIPGNDLTPEAALTKLSYVLAKDDWDLEKKIKMMQTNIVGMILAFITISFSYVWEKDNLHSKGLYSHDICCSNKIRKTQFEHLNIVCQNLNSQ